MESTSRMKPFIMIAKEAVEKLLNEYGLPLQIEEKERTIYDEKFGLMKYKLSDGFHISLLRFPVIHKQSDNTIIQVAKLALLMNSCKTGKIAITCTITNPKEGEVKNTEKKVEIESEFFNHHFSKFLHTLISQGSDNLYTNCITNGVMGDYKKHYQWGDFVFMEDWNEEELKAIIQYEESQIGRLLNEYALIGRKLHFILNKLNEYNLFEGCTQTKVFSFLYDWGVLHGVFNDKGNGFSGKIGKAKFTEVRNRINAYRLKAKELKLEDNGNYNCVNKED